MVPSNQQCPKTIEELQQRVEVAAATVRRTPGVFYVFVQTFCSLLKSVLQVKDNIFNIYYKKVVAFSYVCPNKQRGIVVRTKILLE